MIFQYVILNQSYPTNLEWQISLTFVCLFVVFILVKTNQRVQMNVSSLLISLVSTSDVFFS